MELVIRVTVIFENSRVLRSLIYSLARILNKIHSSGDDSMKGGRGDDLFVLSDGSGHDVIKGFHVGPGSDDKLDISDFGFISFSEVLTTMISKGSRGQHTEIRLDENDSVELIGVNVSELSEWDFIV